MSDVQVTVGASITPFKAAMEQVKAQAVQTGKAVKESLGVESGSFSGFREEQRATRGIERFTAALANAKDPISGFTGAIEGLAQGFRLTGAIFAGFAIGDFVREQLTKAAESAQDFYNKTDAIFAVGKNSTHEFIESSVKSFQEAEKQYENEGWLEKIIYGKGQEATLANARKAAEGAVKVLQDVRNRASRDDAEKSNADPAERLKGEIDLINDEYDEKKKKALENGDDLTNIELARKEKIANAQKSYDDKILSLNKEITDEEEKRAEVGMTSQEKLEASKKKSREAEKAYYDSGDAGYTGVEDILKLKLDMEKAITAEKEAQANYDKDQTDQTKKQLEQFTKQNEQSQKREDLFESQGPANNARNYALNDLSIFHGQTSSLRKIGLGAGVSSNNSEQLKKLDEANKNLDKIHGELEKLTTNLQST